MSVIGYGGNIPPKLLPWRGLKLTSCCQEGIHWMLSVICGTLLFHIFECYHKLSVELCECIPHPQFGSVCLGTGHKMIVNRRCWHRKHNSQRCGAHTRFSQFLIGAPSNKYMYVHQSVWHCLHIQDSPGAIFLQHPTLSPCHRKSCCQSS